ncbi:discoidin domain-containing protein [Enterococcus sp. 5B3_DIV0040]|uniref:discoidin domain-containing protein n=1 Tax=Enterococcus sp. 5B3_DIV0040 TaxID=1834182 RepID=UPI001C38301E|nr:discoidin domain-containing protein [Enterococcus sp. 5B3_DIV0040]
MELAETTLEDQNLVIENQFISRTFEIKEGKLQTTAIKNKLTNETLNLLDSKEFIIKFKEDDNGISFSKDRKHWGLSSSSEAKSLNEGPITFAMDGNLNTIYHSNYGQGTGTINKLPVTVEFSFPDKKDIKTFIYVPRQNGINGNIKEFKIYIKNEDNELYKEIKHDTLSSVGTSPVFIDMGNQENVKSLKLEILSSQNSLPYVSASEFDVSNLSVEALVKKMQSSQQENEISLDKLVLKKNGIERKLMNDGEEIIFSFKPYSYKENYLNIKYIVNLPKNSKYIQSHIEISITGENSDSLLIDTIDMQSYKLPDSVTIHDFSSQPSISEMAGFNGFYAGLGQPVYVNSFYTGSEFPVALNTVTPTNNLYSRYYAGKSLSDLGVNNSGFYRSWNTVIGVARSNDYQVIQQDFFDYISKIGQSTYFRKQFNSWFDYMKNINSENIKSSFNEIERGFVLGGISPLDSYVVDDGWQDMTTLWNFNSKFPNKLYDVSKQVKRFGSDFGLWLGPQGGYSEPGKLADNLVKKGLGSKHAGVVYIGDKRYTEGLAKVFAEYEHEFDINYWKLDGLLLNPRSDSDPSGNYIGGGFKNMYSMTETHERWIKLYQVIRENASEPDKMWINLTSYIPPSPWFLQWVNSIWMQNTADVGYQDGVKEPEYAHLDFGNDANEAITYRDNSYEKLVNNRKWQIPFANIYNHDPVYGNTAHSGKTYSPNGSKREKINFSTEDLRIYLYMLGTRGTGFWEFYYSPSMMDDEKWLVNGEAVNWIEKNYETLKHSKFHGGVPGHGEVYGYSAWDETNGILSIRNPINKEQKYKLKLDRLVGVREGTRNMHRTIILGDNRHNTKELMNYGDEVSITLKPYETVIFQYTKEADQTSANLVHVSTKKNQTIILEFNEPIFINHSEFLVNNHRIESSKLLADLRTVEIKLLDKLMDREEVTIHFKNIMDKSPYSNITSGRVTVIAYENNIIEDISKVIYGETLEEEGIEGTGEFSVTIQAKINHYGQLLAEQKDQWRLYVDDAGQIVFDVKGLKVSSAPFLHLKEDDKDQPDSLVPLSKEFVVTATRMKNGSIKLYINGNLRNTIYSKENINHNLEKSDLVVGTQAFAGEINRFILMNKDTDYKEALEIMDIINPSDKLLPIEVKKDMTKASSYDPNDGGERPASAATDGDKSTYWASNPNKNNLAEPQYLIIEFEEKQRVSKIRYTPRQASPTAVGNIKKVAIEYSNDGAIWKKVIFDNGETIINIPTTIMSTDLSFEPVEAKYIKLLALETHHWNNNKLNQIVSVAELTPLTIIEPKTEVLVTTSYLRNSIQKLEDLLSKSNDTKLKKYLENVVFKARDSMNSKDQLVIDDSLKQINEGISLLEKSVKPQRNEQKDFSQGTEGKDQEVFTGESESTEFLYPIKNSSKASKVTDMKEGEEKDTKYDNRFSETNVLVVDETIVKNTKQEDISISDGKYNNKVSELPKTNDTVNIMTLISGIFISLMSVVTLKKNNRKS